MELINGRQIAEDIEAGIAKQVFDLCVDTKSECPLSRRPGLAIIKIGQRADSELYVKLKEKRATSVGIETFLYLFPTDTTNEEVITAIKFLNADEMIDGILVQLPLPEQLDTDKIIATITPSKDVDGFHPDNLAKLADASLTNKIISPVYASVRACLDNIKFDLSGKSFVVIGQSDIFTRQLDNYLASFGAKVQVFKSNEAWQSAVKQADVVITAVGQPKLISKENIKDGVVIIDIGISQVEGKTVGDVDSEAMTKVNGYVTPVPGGIGPMTIAYALKNTLEGYLKTH